MFDIKEVAIYVIDNLATIEQTAAYFHKSVSSIKKYLAKIRDVNNPSYDPILAEKLKLAQAKISLIGVSKGGSISKRGKSITEEEARGYAKDYLNGQSYRSLSQEKKIPKSTLHENIRSIKDDDLQKSLDEYSRQALEDARQTWKR